MIRHGYHSYRGPAYRGSGLDLEGYGVGIELETDVDEYTFAQATTVRGVRPERDGSLDARRGVEFVFAASDDLRTTVRRFSSLVSRLQFGTNDTRTYYGCHVNVNAATKSAHWRKLMALSGSSSSGNVRFLRQIGRRDGYSEFMSSTYIYGVVSIDSSPMRNMACSGYLPASNGNKFAIALRSNRVEFRIFKTCDNLETVVLYILFSQYWSKWITHVAGQISVSNTVQEALTAVSYLRFIDWLNEQPASSERDAVLNLSRACAHRADQVWSYMNEISYINAAGDAINEVCHSLSTRQRRSRRTAPVAAVLPQDQAVPSLSPA